MTIPFNEISNDINTGGVFIEVDHSQAAQGVPVRPGRRLLIGQRLAAGTVLAGVPTRIFSADGDELSLIHI